MRSIISINNNKHSCSFKTRQVIVEIEFLICISEEITFCDIQGLDSRLTKKTFYLRILCFLLTFGHTPLKSRED